jgi:UDP-hydrolysing UDP-N-acetyl-D-glucosamine 2-epimerase
LSEARRLAILTTGRQDYGILRSTILELRASGDFEPLVWAGGMHLEPRFGPPLELLRRDGIVPSRTVPFLAEPPEPIGDLSRAAAAIGAALLAERPEALLLMGDRSETLAAGLAATVAGVPLVHLHGGEETEGAIDNACRHALTKLSHLHLVSHPAHADRVIQMGEDPASVVVVGAPGLDNRYRDDLPSRSELEQSLGLRLEAPVVLVTMHPTTLGDAPEHEVAALAGALERVPATYVITSPNADAGGDGIRAYWQRWAEGRAGVVLLDALGERRYWALLGHAAAAVGNSSSGIIEAPVAGVPVVNIGDRQKGRLRVGGVTDVPAETDAIAAALREAIAGTAGAQPAVSGYPAGPAAPRIVEALRRWHPERPPRKAFREVACPTA